MHRKEHPVLIRDSDNPGKAGRRGVTRVVFGNRIRFCTTLLVGAAALTLGCEIAKEASWTLEAREEASQQTPARPSPVPAAGPLAEPNTIKQVGVPVEATPAAVPTDNPHTREKIALAQQPFFHRRVAGAGTVAANSSHDPARAFT